MEHRRSNRAGHIDTSKTLHKNVKIQTTNTSKEGEKVLKDEKRDQLLKAIASKQPTQKFFEKLLSYDIKIMEI